MRLSLAIQQRAFDEAPPSEIELLVETATQASKDLAKAINARGDEAFSRFDRHLYFINLFFGRGQLDRCEEDLRSLLAYDVPAILDLVEGWEEALLDAGLVESVRQAWDTQSFDHAVRDAFIYLESTLRRAGGVPLIETPTGAQLAERLLNPAQPTRIALSQGSAYSPVGENEVRGFMNFVKGAFGFLRNPASHRDIEYGPEEADHVLRVIDICVRVLGITDPGPLVLTVEAEHATPGFIEELRALLSRYPGTRPVHLRLTAEGHSGKVLRLPRKYSVRESREFVEETARLLGETRT